MKPLVFLLEEPSAKAMLEGLLPRILHENVTWRFIVFQGKADLERNVSRKIQHYNSPAHFIVLRDQDEEDCHTVKLRLLDLCAKSGRPETLVRIVCHELESWYLADLAAVEKGLSVKGVGRQQGKSRYRAPDQVQRPARELARIAPAYQKVGGSRAIGKYLDPDNTRSKSFTHFVTALRSLVNSQ